MLSLAACKENENTSSDDTSLVNEVLESLTLAASVKEDFILTTTSKDVKIEWTSNNEAIEINDDEAKVTRSNTDVNVTLTAEATKGEVTKEKDFTVKVIKNDNEAFTEIDTVLNKLTVASEVSDNFTLTTELEGVSIVWTSNNSAITVEGSNAVVTRSAADELVTLTATGTKGEFTGTKDFSVKVLKQPTEDYTDEINQILNEIILVTEVDADFSVPTEVAGVNIEWTSNNVAIEFTGANAVVTRSNTDMTVTVTATGTKGDSTSTKTFEIKVLKRVSEVADTIAKALESAIGSEISLTGVTTLGMTNNGIFVTDGTDVMFIYDTNLVAEEGVVYNITGTKGVYEKLHQITAPVFEPSEAELSTVTPVVSTIAEINAEEELNGLYTITATVSVENSKTYLVDGEDKVQISNYSLTSCQNALKELNGLEITLDVFIASKFNTQPWQVFFTGTLEDVIIDDNQILTGTLDSIILPPSVLENLTLPTVGLQGATIRWETSDEIIITTEGVVTRPSTDTEVTLTAIASINGTELSKTFNVTVMGSAKSFDELIISEYYKGASSNRYIEIFNPNDFEIDLSTYILVQANNDTTLATAASSNKVQLSGTLDGKGTYIIYQSAAAEVVKEVIIATANIHFSTTSQMMSYSGDDTIGLFNGAELVDVFGYDRRENFEVDGVSGTMVAIRKIGIKANNSWNPTEWTAEIPTTSDLKLENTGKHLFEFDSLAHEVAAGLNVDLVQNADFTLTTIVGTANIVWTSSDSTVIAISGANATVTAQAGTREVVLTAIVTADDESTYTTTFTVIVEGQGVTTIEGAIQELDGTTVNLSNVTVVFKASNSVVITDGVSSIYCYAPKNGYDLQVGSVYNVSGVNGSYNNLKQIMNNAEFTLVEEGVATTAPAADAIIEQLVSTELFNGTYKVTAIISVSGSTVTLTDGVNEVEVVTDSTDSLNVLKELNGVEAELTVHLSSISSGVRKVLFSGAAGDIVVDDADLANAAGNLIDITDTAYDDITLPTEGAYNTTISWSSSNAAIIANDGTVTRPTDVDTEVTLTATITLNTTTVTVDFVVTVKMVNESGDLLSVTVDFSTVGSSSPSQSSLSKYFDGSIFSVSSVANLYGGSTDGIRMGTTSKIGTFTIVNDDEVFISKIEVTGKQWSNDTAAELSVNGDYQLFTQTTDVYTYYIDGNGDLAFAQKNGGRIFVTSITIYYEL